ncbi:MAG TPA: sialidase family protein [Chloroflexia bacterium]|nr:sialidase family protein [Chloroflexia bacterium]
MAKNRPLLLAALAGLLGLVTVMALVVGRGSSIQTAAGTSNLTVPSANMQLNPNWKAQPASGERVSLPWANIKVNPDSSNEAQNEPFVAVNPNNPNHMVVGANSWLVGNGRYEVFAYVSFDGGGTWAASQPYIDRNAGRINAADPTVAFGPNGDVYFAFVALTPSPGAVAVSRSSDGGLTWTHQSWATSFANAADKPALAAANGKLYVFYQGASLYNTVSSDGATWSAPSAIEANGRNAYPVVDSRGNVSVFYNTNTSIKMARVSGRVSISTVANTTPLQQRPAGYRASIYPAAGVDSAGNMYVAWADGRNSGRGNDILFSRSTDGRIWSAPVTLNSDSGSADQLMPALAVSSNGTVSVAWLDNRNDSANINYDVYMATSYNRGQSFGANTRVTEVSSNPNNDPRMQGTMIGDYFALASGNGVMYSLWTDTRNNNQDIYMAPVTVRSPNN